MNVPSTTRMPDTPRRRAKSPRRALIVETSLRILAERGVEGLSQRAVNEAAGLPPGACSYYFPYRENLAVAAMEQVLADFGEQLRPLTDESAKLTPGMTAQVLTDFVFERTTRHRDRSLAEYELRLAAQRRPELRTQAAQFDEALTAALTGHIGDPAATQLICTTITGYVLQSLISHVKPNRTEIAALIHGLLGHDHRQSVCPPAEATHRTEFEEGQSCAK